MADLIELLERFNRKERYFLVREALDLLEDEFQLSDEFRKKLGCELGIEIRCDAFVAIDYHLDWVAGSLWRYRNPNHKMEKCFPKRDGRVMGNQQDIDLLIAYKDKGDTHRLVFVEAKGYDSKGFVSWNTSKVRQQMKKKSHHLKSIFGPDQGECPKVIPHFCLISPCQPKGLEPDSWPDWMKKDDTRRDDDTYPYYWLQLDLPSDRYRVTRYDPVKDKSSKQGNHFKII